MGLLKEIGGVREITEDKGLTVFVNPTFSAAGKNFENFGKRS